MSKNTPVVWRGLRLLGSAARHEPRVFAAALTASTLYAGTVIATAWAVGTITDLLVIPAARGGSGALGRAESLLLAVTVLRSLSFVARRYLAGVMQFRLHSTYRRRLGHKLLDLPLAWHQRRSAGTLLANVGSDVDNLWQPVMLLPLSCSALAMLVGGIADMAATEPVLGALGAATCLSVIALNAAYQRRADPLAATAARDRSVLSAVAHESIDGSMIVKTLSLATRERARFTAAAAKLRTANLRAGTTRSRFDALMDAVPTAGVLLVILAGALRINAGAATPGQVVQVAYLLTVLAFPMSAMGWILALMPAALAAGDQIAQTLDVDEHLAYGDAARPTLPPDLAAHEVCYTHPGGAGAALRQVSFTAPAGAMTALVGPTGSGKSTLAMLSARLADPDSGALLIAGNDLRHMPRPTPNAGIALVPQEAFLFSDTVRFNITLGEPDDEQAIWEALRLAQAEEFVRHLPRQLEEPIEERGANLSGGQRQRLALARALIRRPALLILDDATSAVDPRIEAAILDELSRLGATRLIAATRRTIIERADRVIYLEDGAVLDQGTHTDLLARCEGYRRLLTAYERDHTPTRGSEVLA